MFVKKINKKNILSIVILLLFFFISFLFLYFNYANREIMEEMGKMQKMQKMQEGLKDMYIETNLSSDFSKSFCESTNSSGAELQTECQKLTQDNCRSTSCCIWTSNQKCDAGGKDGLLFNTGLNGKQIPLDYYYYKDTCYGKNCK
jgi:hypothetical protein